MGMHTTKVAVGEGKFALEVQLTVTPRGMAVYACSPEFAHLGATAGSAQRCGVRGGACPASSLS